MKILITGGCGFVGHHMVEHILKLSDWEIIIWDKLSYASNGLERIREIGACNNKRVSIFTTDFTRPISTGACQECRDIDYILHLGGETHVDNSIKDPLSFVYANVVGTANMLNFALKCDNLKAFVYFSTDEVYGPAAALDENNIIDDWHVCACDVYPCTCGAFNYNFENYGKSNTNKLKLKHSYQEWDRYNSGNPYSATKAGAEQLTLSYMNTYGLPGYISSCMNIFGERQHQEKFIPICVKKILNGEKILIHGDKTKSKSGARFYIHARNVASATMFLLDNFEQRDKYNIVGEKELTNLQLAKRIADIIGKELDYEIVDFHSSRPGHDLRYALDGSKLKNMGFEIPVNIESSLEKTIKWMMDHPQWI